MEFVYDIGIILPIFWSFFRYKMEKNSNKKLMEILKEILLLLVMIVMNKVFLIDFIN